EGIHEDFTLTNYSGKLVRLVLELTLQADFADIFEAKARRFIQRGRLHTNWGQEQRALHIRYTHDDFHRAMVYQIPACGATNSVAFANGCIFWDFELQPGQEWQTCGEIILEHGQQIKKSVYGHRPLPTPVAHEGDPPPRGDEPRSDFDERQARWQAHCTAVE